MQSRACLKLCFTLCLVSSAAQAAEMGGSYKTMNLTLPLISFGRESVVKVEWNLRGRGALGLELNMMGQNEVYSDREMEEKNGDTLMMKGTQFGLLYSQYSNPKMLSGGYWAVGMGYRQVKADWEQTPPAAQNIPGVALNSEGRVLHALTGSGPTALARIGYRYVADSIPFSAGAYLGVRHFQSTMKDADQSDAVETTAEDLTALQRRMMTHLEPGIELGLAF